jgi:hypothetical protein
VNLHLRHQAAPLPPIVLRRFDGEGWVPEEFMYNCRHFTHGPPESPFSEPARPANLEVIGRKLFGDVGSKNLGPWSAPDSLCQCIIIRPQFCFDVSRQCGGQPGVTCISQSSFAKICGECDFALPRLKPRKPLAGLADRAQYVAGHAHCEWPDRFITPDLDVSELG